MGQHLQTDKTNYYRFKLKIIKLINPENVSEEEAEGYRVREASRAVVVDDKGLIAMVYVTRENYYKIPGGGIEKGEDKIVALKRECIEEIGCDVDVIGEIGIVVEYRRIFKLKQTSYCYFAKVIGEKGKTFFTNSEKKAGFEQMWLPYAEAVKVISDNNATSVEGHDYIVPRDCAFLSEAANFVAQNS